MKNNKMLRKYLHSIKGASSKIVYADFSREPKTALWKSTNTLLVGSMGNDNHLFPEPLVPH